MSLVNEVDSFFLKIILRKILTLNLAVCQKEWFYLSKRSKTNYLFVPYNILLILHTEHIYYYYSEIKSLGNFFGNCFFKAHQNIRLK